MAKTTVPIELSSTPSIVDNGNATAITIDSSENVLLTGNGTSNRWLILDETSTYAGAFALQAGGGSAAFGGSLILYGHSHASKAGDVVVGLSQGSGGSFRVNTSGTDSLSDVFVVEQGGNVGIGTTSPADTYSYGKALDIQSSTGGAVYMRDTADTSKFGFTSFDGTTDRLNVGTGGTGTYLRFITVGDERMRIDSSGNVLVGVSAFANNTLGVAIRGASTGASDESIRCAVPSTGSTLQIGFYNANGRVGSVSTSGTSTAFNTSSDYRLKENVVDMDNAITRVKSLQPKRFNFIANPDNTVDGFLAHEVSEVIPEAITGEKDAVNEDGTIKAQGIDQSKIVPLLTGALKEAIAKIEDLEARIQTLEGN